MDISTLGHSWDREISNRSFLPSLLGVKALGMNMAGWRAVLVSSGWMMVSGHGELGFTMSITCMMPDVL